VKILLELTPDLARTWPDDAGLAAMQIDGMVLAAVPTSALAEEAADWQERIGAVRLVVVPPGESGTSALHETSRALATIRRWSTHALQMGAERLVIPGPPLTRTGHVASILQEHAALWRELYQGPGLGTPLLQHNTGHLAAAERCWDLANQLSPDRPGIYWDRVTAEAVGETPGKALPMLARYVAAVTCPIDRDAVAQLTAEQPDQPVPKSEVLMLVRRVIGLGLTGPLVLQPEGDLVDCPPKARVDEIKQAAAAIRAALAEYEEATSDPVKYGKKKLAEAAKRAKELKAQAAAKAAENEKPTTAKSAAKGAEAKGATKVDAEAPTDAATGKKSAPAKDEPAEADESSGA